jgi:hypothetical protein
MLPLVPVPKAPPRQSTHTIKLYAIVSQGQVLQLTPAAG